MRSAFVGVFVNHEEPSRLDCYTVAEARILVAPEFFPLDLSSFADPTSRAFM